MTADLLTCPEAAGLAERFDVITVNPPYIGAGDEVITVANSFIATSEAVTRSGHRVVFCDCEKDTSGNNSVTHSTVDLIPYSKDDTQNSIM